nr:DUF1993 family protein [Methylobacterium sp. SyP6R]
MARQGARASWRGGGRPDVPASGAGQVPAVVAGALCLPAGPGGDYWLRSEPLPQALDDLAREGREAGERPGSLSEAQACIAATLARLDALAPQALDAGADSAATLELPGLTFDMVGDDYARDWALPQFYFHLVTAYALLRSQGVQLGKTDYVPHMFGYLRPGTAS